ncbi:hypothetical protein H2248_003035 [Termitomyces sp. 'cryptogamus']|nr:hypothetical protein H2248_003035 [Termitomyces sp. 'cryptogamus']
MNVLMLFDDRPRARITTLYGGFTARHSLHPHLPEAHSALREYRPRSLGCLMIRGGTAPLWLNLWWIYRTGVDPVHSPDRRLLMA